MGANAGNLSVHGPSGPLKEPIPAEVLARVGHTAASALPSPPQAAGSKSAGSTAVAVPVDIQTDDILWELRASFLELEQLPANNSDGPRPSFAFRRTGGSYRGQWKGNMRHGKGEQRFSTGARYIGRWCDNAVEGLGQFLHKNGDMFIGEWRGNRAHGLGVYYHQRDLMTYATYDGEWAEDRQHGRGVEQCDGGGDKDCQYAGDFDAGKKDGYGVYKWPDDSKYSGQWKANRIHGHGHYIDADGREIRGVWHDGALHGCCRCLWPDGRTYCGKPHGSGVIYAADGSILNHGFWDMGQGPTRRDHI